MGNGEAEARVNVWKYALGFVTMRVVKCAIELGIPDVLEANGSPMKLSEISSAVGCSSVSSLHRIMRFLAHHGIFNSVGQEKENHNIKELEPGSLLYAQTPLSRLLMRDNMGSFVLMQANCPVLPWSGVEAEILKADGREVSSFENDLWKFVGTNENIAKLFQHSMESQARMATSAMINEYPKAFEGVKTLVDVGGRHGMAIGMLVKAFPWIHGINFDLPQVVSEAPTIDGVEPVGGNMFEGVPKADAIMLMWILHDWSDELCINILKRCKEGIPRNGGKVIIVEVVLDNREDEYTSARLAMDITMLDVTVKGKQRTSKEWAHLLNAAGFSSHKITPIKAVQSVIEAYP